MKILEVCAYLYPALQYGGPAKVVYDLSIELSKKHAVTVLTSDVWDQNRRIRSDEKCTSKKNIDFIYTRNIGNSLAYSARFFSCFGMCWYFLKERRNFDIVHIHDVFILPQIGVAWIAFLFNIPVIFSPHGVIDPVRMEKKAGIKNILLSFLVKPMLLHAKQIIATSEKEKSDLITFGFKNVTTVWNGVPLIDTRSKHTVSRGKKTHTLTALYIGKLHSQKGLVELVKAISPFRNHIQLIIAGPDDGVQKQLENTVQKYSLDHVSFTGLVNDSEKKKLYALSDFFVYPSYAEGFSISILEALQAGLPAVITDGCNFDLVAQKNAGYVVPVTNLTKGLVKTFIAIVKQPERLPIQSKNAQNLIEKSFTIKAMANSVEKIYEKAL